VEVLGCYIICSEILVEVDRLMVEVKVDQQQVKGRGRLTTSAKVEVSRPGKVEVKGRGGLTW
jgi:hypothetical protein